MFLSTNAQKETPLAIHFTYLVNKEVDYIFKTCCIIYVLFPTQYRLFHNCTFFCSKNKSILNCALKFKYHLGHLEVKGRTYAI